MNKFQTLLLVFIFFHLLIPGVSAKKVDPVAAQTLATNFYFERCLLSGHKLRQPAQLILSYTRFSADEEVYYAFSSDKGFIIVAADDDVYPVLAYSFEGKFPERKMSPEFKFWMDTYEDQIIHVRENNLSADERITAVWSLYSGGYDHNLCDKGTTKSVEPLLMSTWDQGTFYNSLCPEDAAGPDGHVWSGCVATCMAQVMYYYRYPQQGAGSHGYYSDYGYLYADFGSTTYNWDLMQNDINSNYNYDMALLQLHCGIAIDMGYSPDGSGAYMYDDVYAMINNFGYSPSTELFYKNDYSDTQWANMIIDDLDSKMPVQYAGYGEDGGHAFVCDGYQGTDYFHFNWGWSGSYNGYFYLNNLNPGYTFNHGQQVILNSYPAGNYPQMCSNTRTLSSSYGTIDDGSGPNNNYQNNTDCMWLISPDDSIDQIRIHFEKLNTEASEDLITFYNGESTSDSVLAVVSGNTIPSDIITGNKKILVRFTSNGSNTAEGWLLSYSSKEIKFCNNITELTAPSGLFSDGSGTYDYNSTTFCRWRIDPPNATAITIHFNSFDLADDQDYMKVFDETAGTELYTFYSGAVPQTFAAYTGKILLLFRTRGAYNGNGWEIYYNSEPMAVSEIQKGYVSIAPNPATEYINVKASVPEAQALTFDIYDNTGKLVLSKQLSTQKNLLDETLDVSNLAKGMYFLKLTSENFHHTQKLVIR